MNYVQDKCFHRFRKEVPGACTETIRRYLESLGWFMGNRSVYPRRKMGVYYEDLFSWMDDLEINPVVFVYWVMICTGESIKMMNKGPAYLSAEKNKRGFESWLKTGGPDVQYGIISSFLEQGKAPTVSYPAARMEQALRDGHSFYELTEDLCGSAANQLMGMPCLRQLCYKSRETLEQEVEGGIVWIT